MLYNQLCSQWPNHKQHLLTSSTLVKDGQLKLFYEFPVLLRLGREIVFGIVTSQQP